MYACRSVIPWHSPCLASRKGLLRCLPGFLLGSHRKDLHTKGLRNGLPTSTSAWEARKPDRICMYLPRAGHTSGLMCENGIQRGQGRVGAAEFDRLGLSQKIIDVFLRDQINARVNLLRDPNPKRSLPQHQD